MKFKPQFIILTLFTSGLALRVPEAVAECRYALTAPHLLQCRPIKLIENEEHKALWTYVDDSTRDGVLAHILCSCDTAATGIQPLCEPPRTHKLTFTVETQDIRETCSQGAALCQTPCLQLINH